MNIHPAFVHFPIAILFLYTFVEIVPLRMWFPRVPWAPLRDFLLYVGTVTIIPTIATGLIDSFAEGETPLIETHEHAAIALFFIFLAAVGISIYTSKKGRTKTLEIVMKVLAFLGLIGLFVVGALGASIVYGPDSDPFVHFVYGIFFP